MIARKSAIWTDDEISILREMRLANMPAPKIATRLERPVGAVYAMARKIGTRVMVRSVWTDEEDAKLTALVGRVMTDKEIAEEMGRSVSSVRWRMEALDLIKDRVRPVVKRAHLAKLDKPRPERKPAARKPEKRPARAKVDLEALRALAGTHTRAEAAAAIGLSVSKLNYVLRDHDISFLDPREEKAKVDRAAVAELHAAGRAPAAIADEIGRPLAWVNRALADLGVRKIRKRGKAVDLDIAELRELAATKSITEVARMLHRDPRTLRKLAEEHGFDFSEPARRIAEPRVRKKVDRAPAPRVRKAPPLPKAEMRRRLMLIRDIAERMRAEGRLPA